MIESMGLVGYQRKRITDTVFGTAHSIRHTRILEKTGRYDVMVTGMVVVWTTVVEYWPLWKRRKEDGKGWKKEGKMEK